MLTDSYKKKLNFLIPYYREKHIMEGADGTYQQQYFYMENGVSICSSSTYCALEKNQLLANDAIYHFAAVKLHKRAEEKRTWDTWIQELTQQLFHFMNFKNEMESIEILNNYLPKLKECEEVLYYGEIYWLFEKLRAFLVNRNDMINEKEFYHLDSIASIYEGKLKELAMYYLFVYANYHEDEKIEHVLHTYPYDESEFISNRIFSIRVLHRNQYYMSSYEKYKELETELISSANTKQLLQIYMDIIGTLKDFDIKKTEVYRDKIIKLIHTNELSEQQKWHTYMNLGSLFTSLGDFPCSIQCLKQALKISDKLAVRAYICLCYSYHIFHGKIPEIYLKAPKASKGDKIDWVTYKYYLYMKKRTNEENKRYILKEVLPCLNKNDTLYLKILRKEIDYLCKISKGYKALYEFDNMIGKK